MSKLDPGCTQLRAKANWQSAFGMAALLCISSRGEAYKNSDDDNREKIWATLGFARLNTL